MAFPLDTEPIATAADAPVDDMTVVQLPLPVEYNWELLVEQIEKDPAFGAVVVWSVDRHQDKDGPPSVRVGVRGDTKGIDLQKSLETIVAAHKTTEPDPDTGDPVPILTPEQKRAQQIAEARDRLNAQAASGTIDNPAASLFDLLLVSGFGENE